MRRKKRGCMVGELEGVLWFGFCGSDVMKRSMNAWIGASEGSPLLATIDEKLDGDRIA